MVDRKKTAKYRAAMRHMHLISREKPDDLLILADQALCIMRLITGEIISMTIAIPIAIYPTWEYTSA